MDRRGTHVFGFQRQTSRMHIVPVTAALDLQVVPTATTSIWLGIMVRNLFGIGCWGETMTPADSRTLEATAHAFSNRTEKDSHTTEYFLRCGKSFKDAAWICRASIVHG